MAVREILGRGISSSGIVEVRLPSTKSQIISQNKGLVYCSVYKGLRGLFRKDIEETREFGRRICDSVKEKLGNNGFFTSDELPNYGISEEEKAKIANEAGAGADDLVAIVVYDKEESKKTKELLDKLLTQAQTP